MNNKRKKISIGVVFAIISGAIVIACSDNSGSNDSNLKHASAYRESSAAYLDQIPFVTAADTIVDGSFVVHNDFYQNVEDKNVSWTYFDNLYNASLESSIKQKISYVVLCKKDLIGLVNEDPNNATLVTALKRHIDNLVETEYLGYTALYFALDALQNTGKDFNYIEDKAAEIVLYAGNDLFHPEMINAGSSEVGEELYDKIVDNHDYVAKISDLQ